MGLRCQAFWSFFFCWSWSFGVGGATIGCERGVTTSVSTTSSQLEDGVYRGGEATEVCSGNWCQWGEHSWPNLTSAVLRFHRKYGSTQSHQMPWFRNTALKIAYGRTYGEISTALVRLGQETEEGCAERGLPQRGALGRPPARWAAGGVDHGTISAAGWPVAVRYLRRTLRAIYPGTMAAAVILHNTR